MSLRLINTDRVRQGDRRKHQVAVPEHRTRSTDHPEGAKRQAQEKLAKRQGYINLAHKLSAKEDLAHVKNNTYEE